jgi:hypothetical protein
MNIRGRDYRGAENTKSIEREEELDEGRMKRKDWVE